MSTTGMLGKNKEIPSNKTERGPKQSQRWLAEGGRGPKDGRAQAILKLSTDSVGIFETSAVLLTLAALNPWALHNVRGCCVCRWLATAWKVVVVINTARKAAAACMTPVAAADPVDVMQPC
jgi:hypothetical protein